MEQKNYTEVFIDGTVFTLGGTEDEAYLRQVAAYLNEKIGEVRKMDGFSRQSPEYQNLTIQLNLSDDYFKEQMRADDLKQQKEELEKDAYSLKHELITTQMKYEAQSRELEVAKAAPLKDREELEAAKEKKTEIMLFSPNLKRMWYLNITSPFPTKHLIWVSSPCAPRKVYLKPTSMSNCRSAFHTVWPKTRRYFFAHLRTF